MRKLTTITTALILALAVGAGATVNQPAQYDVRPFTMGGEKINNILKSGSNIWLYPQTLNMYADQAEGIFDANELRRLGIHYQFGTDNPFVLGIYVNNTSGAEFNPYDDFNWVGTAPLSGAGALADNNLYDVFWARDMNGNPFGIHLQIYNSSNETAGTTKNSLSVFALDVGMSAGMIDWAVSIGFTTFTEQALNAVPALVDLLEPDGNLNVEGRVRKWFPGGWVGHASLGLDKIAFKTTATGATEEWKTLDAEVGLGFNYTPTSSVHAVLDFGFQYMKADFEALDGTGTVTTDISDKDVSIPPYYALGFDAEVLSWLDVRMGASNIRRVQTNTTAGVPDVDATFDDVNTYVGVGLHFGNLTLDAQLNPAFVTEGPDFIGGDGTGGSNNMFMFLAATYNFGN